MGLNCGIVGLPNVGKSTLFQALTSAPAEVANYPFCTIGPNVGIVNVQDPRLDKITKLVKPQKTVPTVIEIVDIAGLVKGASKGEGLGNQFLGNIRQVNAILHVVRCFDDTNVVHVHGEVDPISDIETINTELALADLEVVERKLDAIPKMLKNQNKEIAKEGKILKPILDKMQVILAEGSRLSDGEFDEEDLEAVKSLNLITLRPVLYVCNVDEDTMMDGGKNDYVEKVQAYAAKENSEAIVVCGKLEAEIAGLDSEEEKKEFMKEVGIDESGLTQLTNKAYALLNLQTYFTAGEKEVRAWTFHKGAKAPETAGIIHTDFERGFIRAEVFNCEDLFELGSELKVKEKGKLRVEGKEYVVQDGDIMHFRFNV